MIKRSVQSFLKGMDPRTALGVLGSLIVAFVLGRQLAAGSFLVPGLLVSFGFFLMIFFRKGSVVFLLPFVLLLPNWGLDIPGPWAVTVEDAFILALFGGYLFRVIINKEKIFPRRSPVILPLVIFWLVAFISLFKSAFTGGSFLSNIKDLMRLTELVFLYIVLVDVLDTRRRVELFVRNLLILGVFYAAVSLYIYFTLSDFFYFVLTMKPAYLYVPPFKILRMVSIAGTTSQTGMFYAALLALAAFFPPLKRTRNLRFARTGLLVLFGLCILLTFNRGTWVGVLLGFSVLTLRGRLNWRTIIVVTAMFLALAILVGLTIFGQADVEGHAIQLFEVSKSSGMVRWVRWVSAVNVILDQPILGVGYNNYAWLYGKYSILEGAQEYGSPHNMIVDVVTGTGLLGFAIFAYLLAKLWRTHREIHESSDEWIRNYGSGLFLGFIFFLGASMFDSFFFKPHHTGILLFSLWSVATVVWRELDSQSVPVPRESR
jgi:O-antigen ligase